MKKLITLGVIAGLGLAAGMANADKAFFSVISTDVNLTPLNVVQTNNGNTTNPEILAHGENYFHFRADVKKLDEDAFTVLLNHGNDCHFDVNAKYDYAVNHISSGCKDYTIKTTTHQNNKEDTDRSVEIRITK